MTRIELNDDDDDLHHKYDSGSYVNALTFSNSFDEDAISTTNMFIEILLQYNDNRDVVIT